MAWIKLFVFGGSKTMQLTIAGVQYLLSMKLMLIFCLFCFEVGEELVQLGGMCDLNIAVLFDMV